MRELFEYIKAVIARWTVLLTTGVVNVPAQAQFQAPVFLDLKITATFEYPTEVRSGDTFPVYLRINNNSDRFIEAPMPSYVLVRSDTGLIYRSDICRMHCLIARSRMIAPGGNVLIHMGDVYTSEPGLTEGQIGYGDARIIGYTAERQLYAIDIDDVLPIIIKPPAREPGPGIPARRQPLELSEDQRFVHDPNNGYDWLRFDETVGITKEQLQSSLQPGGDLYGFNIASRNQVQTLIRNQLLAAGVAAQGPGLSDYLGVDGLVALKQLVELLQATGETDSKLFVNGVVSDPIPLTDDQPQFVTLKLYGAKSLDTDYFSSPFGLHTLVADEAELATDRAETGVWLVRGAEMNRHKSSGRATYANDYLFLPNVLIDGNHYRLELYRKEGNDPSFVVTNLQAASAADLTQPTAEFDAVTNQLTVGNVEVLSDYRAGKYDLRLEIIPGTDVPLARLVDMSLSAPLH